MDLLNLSNIPINSTIPLLSNQPAIMKIIRASKGVPEKASNPQEECPRQMDRLGMVSKWRSGLDNILEKDRNDYKAIQSELREQLREIHSIDVVKDLIREARLNCKSLSEDSEINYPHTDSKPRIQSQAYNQTQSQADDRTFHPFRRLPAEMRIDIWQYAFAEDLLPKVHHLNRVSHGTENITDSITSHLPFSKTVHVCRESRYEYLARTRNVWAFGTYINFHSDIIYFTKEVEDSNELYESLLSSPQMMKVQNLALRRTCVTDSPQRSTHHVESFAYLRGKLPSLKNLYVVTNEVRPSAVIDEDKDIKFKHLSARQKRKWYDVGYARAWTKWLNERMIDRGYKSIDIHFVMVGTKCMDTQSSEYGETTFERKLRNGMTSRF